MLYNLYTSLGVGVFHYNNLYKEDISWDFMTNKTYRILNEKGEKVEYNAEDFMFLRNVHSSHTYYDEKLCVADMNDTAIVYGFSERPSHNSFPINGLLKIVGEESKIQETKDLIEKKKNWKLEEIQKK